MLSSGDRIGIISPASAPKRTAHVAEALERVSTLGFVPVPGTLTRRHAEDGPHTPSAEERAQEFLQTWTDPTLQAVWALRGGYGCLPLLPHLDLQILRRHPKTLIGYSDLSVLHYVLPTLCDLQTWHGPMLVEELSDQTWESVRRALTEPAQTFEDVPTLVPAEAVEGRLLGGNLTLLVRLLGTPWSPALARSLLFLEDVNEPPHRVHGMLTQLVLAGALDEVRGILLGGFSASGTADWKVGAVEEAALDALQGFTGPVVGPLPIGHVPEPLTLPCGGWARLDTARRRLAVRPCRGP